MGDAGLTGRKIIVDTYGGMARHGGAFSGKDPLEGRPLRCYALRWVTTWSPLPGPPLRGTGRLYAIGKAAPVGVFVETFGTGVIPDEDIHRPCLVFRPPTRGHASATRPAAPDLRPDLGVRPLGRELPLGLGAVDRAADLKAAAGLI